MYVIDLNGVPMKENIVRYGKWTTEQDLNGILKICGYRNFVFLRCLSRIAHKGTKYVEVMNAACKMT